MIPSLFVSHGAPTLPFDSVPARDFLGGLGDSLGRRPSAILAVSAHWETERPTVNVPSQLRTIHDFRGFDPALYRLEYPAPSAPALGDRVEGLLSAAGLACDIDPARGLDHGAWVPLMLMYREADIPVAQLSVQSHLGPAHHLELGRALAPLRAEDVLILGSGSFTHDLSSFAPGAGAGAADEPAWVSDFADWMDDAIADQRVSDLICYRRLAPHAARNHPTEEHLLPMFVAMGAGDGEARRLHSSVTHRVLRMDAYAFG